ncbi:MAG: hypothetical protein KTR29_01365 [Rhodothermaceae bacterium]|nr:hypothetical protein [Rhodothermaceae bacterium]
MTELGINHFLAAVQDLESAQYRVLHSLQQAKHAFSQNIIYPHLSSLVQLHHSLQDILKGMIGVEKGLPRRVKDIDTEKQELLYEYESLCDDEVAQVKELVNWAMPHIQSAIEEGKTIFEFVDNNIHIGEVGIIPSYVEEGYLILPNQEENNLYILKYDISLFTDVAERYRSLRTNHIKTLPMSTIRRSPHAIKLELIEEHRELPNPATYVCDIGLEFPFEQTVLPIAKRKLMRHLYIQGGLA